MQNNLGRDWAGRMEDYGADGGVRCDPGRWSGTLRRWEGAEVWVDLLVAGRRIRSYLSGDADMNWSTAIRMRGFDRACTASRVC